MRRLFAAVPLALFVAGSARAQTPEEEFVPWSKAVVAPATGDGEKAQEKGKADGKKAEKKEKKNDGVAPASATEQAPAAEGEAMSSPEEWASPPELGGDAPVVAPEPTAPPPAPPGPAVTPGVRTTPKAQRPPVPAQFNDVSIYGAPTLGQWRRGLGAYLGFPLLGLKAGIGLLDGLDVGVGFDSFYGVMNEARVFTKVQLFSLKNWSMSALVEGGAAFFTQRPEAEGKGARWLTGRRNYNLEPGLLVSYRGNTVQSARLFLDVRYHLAFDTQPYAKNPLEGTPPPVVLGHNLPVRLGAEMPFSPSTSFLFIFGFDIHGRAEEDSPFMPVVSVGLVTGL